MTPQGYGRRIYAIEWHGKLWAMYGTPIERCQAMISHCSQCVEADYYGVDRPVTDDPEIAKMQAYFDRCLFTPFNPATDLISFE